MAADDDYPRLELIVAVDRNWAIGKDNKLPWHLPSEFAYYQRMSKSAPEATKVHASIYARSTWESIPPEHRPWGNTICFILSRTMTAEDVERYGGRVHVHPTWQGIIDHLRRPEIRTRIDRVWVHGGVVGYKAALRSPHFHRLYLTKIDAAYPADVFFPPIDESRLALVHDPNVPQGVQIDGDVNYRVLVYQTTGLNPLLEDASSSCDE